LLQPVLDNYAFPVQIITEAILERALNKQRIQLIREELLNPENENNVWIRCKVPWYDKGIIEPESQDFIFSHVVIQHIDDINNTFFNMNYWLKPGGYVSHLIDYKSLGFTTRWNGHWTFSDWEWRILVGGRKFSQNKLPHSAYIQLFEAYNFKILFMSINKKGNALTKSMLAKKYRMLSQDDLCTCESFIVAQKPLSA
jgi:SAM-dependent methyltransferase